MLHTASANVPGNHTKDFFFISEDLGFPALGATLRRGVLKNTGGVAKLVDANSSGEIGKG